MKIDLHCHSLHSDGALSPADLLKRALAANLHMLALTDHDTVEGIPALLQAAHGQDIRIIPGIELSIRWKLHDVHILGLNIDIHHPALKITIFKQHAQRLARAQLIANKLETLGLKNIYQKARDLARHDRIGRPHIAQVLINENIVPDMQAAFTRYLSRGKVAYVPTEWIRLEEAVEAITQAGGVAVIAHPLKYKFTLTKLKALTTAFKLAGGTGIEVISGEMTPAQIQSLIHLSRHFNLLASSGSDFHHDGYSRIKLGQQTALPEICIPIWRAFE